jgi:hypothetical protein
MKRGVMKTLYAQDEDVRPMADASYTQELFWERE